ncbi:uncharacterized protein LOC133904128 isoform X2 [Phragmites australis]|uniref:uncharacterized protein LOC133904128 isoform X2 n=1 Tax=Phragmites australis TaxID=29695 RepID=UPI002D76D627|nr:uncharacterized protein LOC133904128 isoform X2 [Phragmites australis]
MRLNRAPCAWTAWCAASWKTAASRSPKRQDTAGGTATVSTAAITPTTRTTRKRRRGPTWPRRSSSWLRVQGLVQCATLRERNLLADVCAHLERQRAAGARRRDLLRLVAASLRAAGHDAAVCVSRWGKFPSHPAGEHAYLDVLLPAASDRGAHERVLVDVDFRSAFEVARPTKAYRALLQQLPAVFVGKDDRLRLLVAAAADAARASLKKRGLHLPPWRKPEYMRAKWLSPYDREVAPPDEAAAAEVHGEGTAAA